MESLSRESIESYRRKLLDLRWELAREYWKEREASLQQGRQGAEDTVDLAASSYARDFLLSLSEEDRKRLFQVEEALARIERGEYGRCSNCRARIPGSRLAAVPWASLCVVCQGLQEEGLLPRWTFSTGRSARKTAGAWTREK